MCEKCEELEGKILVLEQTVNSLITRINDLEVNASVVTQTLNSIISKE